MKKLLIALVLVSLVAGCKKDYFEVGPTSSAAESEVYKSTVNAAAVINGVYRYLYSRYSAQNQPGQGGVMLMLEFMGDDLNQANSTWFSPGNGTGGWVNHRIDSYGYVEFPFRLYYRCIGNANALLDNVDAAEGPDSDKKLLKAEALTMRAWCYFNLVQIFAKRYDKTTVPNAQLGVSLALSSLDKSLPRSTVEEVYTQINKDLAEAITLFAGAVAQPKSHLNIKSAYAIRARVALTMQDYVNAAAYANQVITLGGNSLMTNTQYQAGFNDISNPEWIWGAFVQDDQGDTFGSYFGQISYNGNTTYVRGTPKRINSALYNMISATDVRKKMWEPSPTTTNFPLPSTTFSRSPYMSRKFSIRNLPTIGDVPYIRLAEMYLIIAEANANIPGNEVPARQALNTLAVNRDPSYVMSTNSGAALINEIMFHRRVELWGEGMRWFDLKRQNQPLDRRTSVVPNYVSATGSGTLQVPAGSLLWQFVIPISELQANLNSVQNP